MITDNQEEIFDVVDEDDRVIGQATRADVHSNKTLIHRSIGVAIFNKKGEIFLQQRSTTKDTDPLLWTVSCSGHVESGDSYEESAKRELREELGIIYKRTSRSIARGPLEPLKPIAKYICRAPNETEMQMLFKATHNGSFQLNKTEITQGKFFAQNELKNLIKDGQIKLSFMGKRTLEELEFI